LSWQVTVPSGPGDHCQRDEKRPSSRKPGIDHQHAHGTAHAREGRTLDLLTRWAPTADFVSIAVSRDGSLVYVLGTAGVDANGSRSDNQNSLTVYNTASGELRLVEGDLGSNYLGFTEPLQP
jgi:hypothetical protein